MKTEQLIRVLYPANGDRLLLRTDKDWDASVQGIRVSDHETHFRVATERPFFYFKPVLASTNGIRWSRGDNYLVTSTANRAVEVYPHFSQDSHCSVCELMPPLTSPSGIEHRFRVFLPP